MKTRRVNPFRYLRRLAVILGLLVVAIPAAAQQQYEGLDILFLVDQSGSMGGADFGYADEHNPRDPDGLRFEVLSYALDTLTQYQAVVPQNTPFRMAAVYFGDDPFTMLDWRSVSGDAAEAAGIKTQLAPDNFRRNLGNTDFLSAFAAAQQMFAQLPTNENHLRVIIILTDGAPCAPKRFNDPQCNSQTDQITHMQDLIAFAQTAFPAPQYRLRVIAIDATNAFWPLFEPYWNQAVGATGSAARVEDSAQIAQTFVQFLTDSVLTLAENSKEARLNGTLGQQIQFTNQQADIIVPPYHQLMRLTIFKLQPAAQISLTDPQGQAVTEASANVVIVGRDGIIETWTVTNPIPGRWLLATTETSRSSLSLDLIRVAWQFDPLPEPINRYEPVALNLQLIDANDQPLPVYGDTRYTLAVTLTAHPPSGSTETITLSPNALDSYTANYTPTAEGEYHFDLLATTQNVDGSPLVIFDQPDVLQFTVGAISFQAEVEPLGDLLVSQAITVTARIVDSAGNLVAMPDAAVKLTVTAPNGDTTYDLVAEAGQPYTTTLALEAPGQYQVRVRALLTAPDGLETLIGEQVFNPFRVQPAAFVLLRLLQPPTLTEYTTTGFPPTTPVDTVISVQANSDTGETADLTALAGGVIPLQVTITALNPEAAFVPPAITFQSTTTAGLYEATIPNLPVGDYTITVTADRSATLANSTLFDPRTYTQTIKLSRANNPALLAFIVGSVVLVLAIVSGIVFFVLRRRALGMHPARGKIELFREPYDDTDIPLITILLDRERKNRVRRGSPAPGVKWIEIRCPNNAMSNARQVFVTIETQSGKPLNSTLLGPHDDRFFTAGELEYRIVKDRDADYDI